MTDVTSFNDFSLSENVLRACSRTHFTQPTQVQSSCIPRILGGSSILACAKTGTGKTAAYVLPILTKLEQDRRAFFALVLAPTRELVVQIADQFRTFGSGLEVSVSTIIGGMDRNEQMSSLDQLPEIVVATPGRLADIIRTSCGSDKTNDSGLSFERISFLVLDEGDRLFVDSFTEPFEWIMSSIGDDNVRQTLLFSATLTENIDRIRSLVPDLYIYNAEDETTCPNLRQEFVLTNMKLKDPILFIMLIEFFKKDLHDRSSVMVFVRTCEYCQILCRMFNRYIEQQTDLVDEVKATALHSLIGQKQRLKSLADFRSRQAKVLFATDVASRGLDIHTVDLVINHNVPLTGKQYLHRVGRTARAGRSGRAITFVTQFELKRMHRLENAIDKSLVEVDKEDAVDPRAAIALLPMLFVMKAAVKLELEDEGFARSSRLMHQTSNE